MLALALGFAAQTAPVAEETDIVVLGRRLESISAMVGRDARGRFTCDLSQSSGNRRLDMQLCKTATDCVRKGAREAVAVKACIDKRKPDLLADLKRTMGR